MKCKFASCLFGTFMLITNMLYTTCTEIVITIHQGFVISIPDPLTPVLSFEKERTSQHCQDKFFLWKRQNCPVRCQNCYLIVWEPPIKGPHTQPILTASFFERERERENQSRVHIPDLSPYRFYHWPHSIVMLPSKWSVDLILRDFLSVIS